MMPQSPQRILLIRLSSLGDIVLTSPAIRAVRKAFPDAYISMIVGSRSADVVWENPHLDEVIPFDRKSKGRNTSEMRRVMRHLRQAPFDLSIDFQRKLRTALLASCSGAKVRVGYHEAGGFLSTVQVPEPSEGHAVERNLALLAAIGIPDDGPETEMHVSEETRRFAAERLPRGTRRRLGFFPGAGWKLREWMPERLAALGDLAAERYGAEVVIFGGPAEMELVNQIAEQMKHPTILQAATLTVAQLAALIARCDLLISNDTGPMHISVAMKTPTIALFGPGDHLKFGPLGESHQLIRHAVPCSPCKQFTNRCKSNVCMQQIQVDEVWQAIQNQWGSA